MSINVTLNQILLDDCGRVKADILFLQENRLTDLALYLKLQFSEDIGPQTGLLQRAE